jgi:hypothetical protein
MDSHVTRPKIRKKIVENRQKMHARFLNDPSDELREPALPFDLGPRDEKLTLPPFFAV